MYSFPFILQTAVWIPTRLVLAFFVRFRVTGMENLKGLNRNAIIAANHKSELDPILVPAALNPFKRLMPIFYISREREFYEKNGLSKYIYGGLWFRMWGAYPALIGKNNYKISLKNHLKLLHAGKTILVFPEGGKTQDGSIGKGKGGVVYLAHATDTPIIPLAMKGHYKMSLKDFFLRRCTIELHFGKPLYQKNLFSDPKSVGVDDTRDDYLSAAQKVMDAIRALHQT